MSGQPLAPALLPGNRLLAGLPPRDLALLAPRLERVRLACRAVLTEPDERVTTVYFPEGAAIVSLLLPTADGRAAKTACADLGGVVGLAEALGDGRALAQVVVEIPGTALRCAAGDLQAALRRSAGLRGLFDRRLQAFAGELAQNAACHALHTVRQRVARWLLFAHEAVRGAGGACDGAAPWLPLTQEMLADMVGAQRTTVTAIAGELQEWGTISCRRGRIRVLDGQRLRREACGCDGVLQAMRRRMLGQAAA